VLTLTSRAQVGKARCAAPLHHRPLPNLIQHAHQLGHTGWQEQRFRPLLANVGEWRLIQPGRVRHAFLGQVLHDAVDELQLAGLGDGAEPN
jgi:hypothetical protein